MNEIFRGRGRGFALIEALIAFVVVAAGLLALAPLYSDMMGGSSLAKARAEALEAARGQNEVLRNAALKSQFDLDLVNGSRTWTGKNADFTMTWTMAPDPTGTNPPKYKTVTTSVAWTDPKEGLQTVRLPTQVLFKDPALSAGIQDRALCQSDPTKCRALDSPWTSGYEGPHPSTAGQTPIGSIVVDNQGTSTTSDDVSIKTYDGGNVEVIYGDKVRFTAFGGVVHRIRGRIWLTENARSVLDPTRRVTNPLAVIASSPAWCLFPICDGPSDTCALKDTSGSRPVDWRIASYVCYVSGDCTKGGAGCVTGFNDSFASKRLNGGWYGSVGNFSVFLDPDDAVCTMDTNIAGGDALRLTPSRQYASYRVSDSGAPESCTASGVVSAVETRLDPWPDARYNADQPDQDQPHGPIELDLTRTFRGFCVSGTPKASPSIEGINASFAYQDFVIGNRTEINSEGCAAIAAKTRNTFIRSTFCSLRASDGFIQALPPSSIGRALNLDSLNKSVPENQSYGGPCP